MTSQTSAASAWFTPARLPLTAMLGTGFVSMISNNLTGLAVPWFVLELTGSAGKMGITAAATMLPSVVMSFLGGAIADRTNPRLLSVFSDVISGVTVALVPLLFVMDLLTFPILLALMIAGAIFDAPGYAARSKMLPQLAERGMIQIEKVTSIQGIFQAVSTLFGAILAGVLISFLGATNVLWINAAAFALSALAILAAVPNLHIPREAMPSITADIKEGMRYVWHHPILRPLTGAALVLNAAFAPLSAVLLPYMAKTEWDSATAFGLSVSGFGAGALVGSVVMGKFSDSIRRSTIIRVSLLLLTAPVFILVAVPPLPVAWVAFTLMGVAMGMVNPMIQAMFFRITEPELLGRVNGVIGAGAMVAMPLGVMLATPVLSAWGLPFAYGLIGGILALNAIVFMRSPAIRLMDELGSDPTPASMNGLVPETTSQS
ncbi:MAG: MFS transporter [Thermomicrobiales bacterium]|nr:MFS transporter [Thermomicrobiales bacterium]